MTQLWRVERRLTLGDNSIDANAVERVAQDYARKHHVTIESAREAWLRAAEHEQWDCADKERRNREWQEQQWRDAEDAEMLARHYGYDIDRLQSERDRQFYGTWGSRERDLARLDRALKVARDRAAAFGRAA